MKHLHLISFNIPEPPNYGGIIDVFYRVKAFYEVGIKVTLHCFYHDRGPAEELKNYCSEIYYYPRQSPFNSLSLRYPMMMKSRNSKQLLEKLSKDGSPVFFEGIQTCYALADPVMKGRIKTVKIHNIEWKYYGALGKAAINPLKKLFYFSESVRLRKAEKIFHHADYLLAVSKQEAEYYKKHFTGVKRLPSFHGNRQVTSLQGTGDFLLYHGNLEIAENRQAIAYLLKAVIPYVSYKLVITGRNPGSGLVRLIKKFDNVELVANPSDEYLGNLVHNAHIHLLPTFQNTGFKIKLINTLYQGRHCLVSPEMAEGSGLERLCVFAASGKEFVQKINELMNTPFTEEHINERRKYLFEYFDDLKNADYIKGLIFGNHN